MKNKDEFSMTKLGLTSSNSQQNIFTLDYTRNNNRNNFNHTTINKKENVFRSLPKLKYGYLNNEKKNNPNNPNNPNNQNSKNYNNSNASTLINFCDKKKLSFYKGSNISLSSFFLDTNNTKTISTDMKNSSSSFTKIKPKKNKNFFFRRKLIDEKNEINPEKQNAKKKVNEIKSTLNPFLDISKLTYKTTITSIRNKYSILFNKEFDLFDKFVPSLYTLKFDHETKFYLNQLHNKVLSCTKYLSSTFLDQDIETFKINETNLEIILTNLLQLFIFNNKINNSLIRHTKKIMIEYNREKQDKKEIVEDDINTQIKNLQKKLENKNEKIKQIKNEKFQEHNDYIINMKKLRDEQNDLVKLLKKNMEYFNMYKDCQKEIKEKNNLIIQQKMEYNDMMDKNFFDKAKLEEDICDLKDFIKPIQDENEMIKNKTQDLEEKLSYVNEIIKRKNDIITALQENLMMKEEEINTYIINIDKIKEQNDKISYNYIALKNKYQTLSKKKFGFTQFDYENKIKDDD